MNTMLDNLVGTSLEKIEDSPLKNILGNALKESLEKQKDNFESLILAKKQGFISQDDFDTEIKREKDLLEADMLTKQITEKVLVQKLVNDAMAALTKGLV